MKLNLFVTVMSLAFAVFLIRNASGVQWTPNHIIGVCIAIPALLFLTIARIQLGSAFSVRAKASTLVTTGLYSRIRNPIYVFGAILIAGAIVFFDRLWFLLIFVILIPMQILRSREEAKMLEEKFGSDYIAYKKKTWF